MSNDWSIQPLSFSPKDKEFIEARKFLENMIVGLAGIPHNPPSVRLGYVERVLHFYVLRGLIMLYKEVSGEDDAIGYYVLQAIEETQEALYAIRHAKHELESEGK